ncbi:copper amine oxidase N-terminal domain-containing protein [Pelotomaculum sp. PtaB.Bin117]|uniref:copper amine oxidase N-terminal domain-containing protein n=1 Tax=Pelotomaculum sp. PtaB.Bin117 TaxID=1811694 RepID=UPI00338FA116
MVEAETNRGAGRYALLWSYKGDTQLSSLKGEEIRIMIDFTTIQPEVPPFTKNDRTMVPLRVIAESMGAHVNWSSSENRIDIVSHETVSLWIGKTEATKDKQPLFIDVAPEIVDGRTFVPLRFVAEALGAKVTWDERTKTVSILS